MPCLDRLKVGTPQITDIMEDETQEPDPKKRQDGREEEDRSLQGDRSRMRGRLSLHARRLAQQPAGRKIEFLDVMAREMRWLIERGRKSTLTPRL